MPGSEPVVRKDSRLFMEMCSAVQSAGKSVRFRVNGQSMQPNLCDGDEAVVAPVSAAEIRCGDVVLAENADGLRVHRVHSIDPASGQILLRSDTSCTADPAVNRVFGRVRSFQRGSGEQDFTVFQTRLAHPARIVVRRLWAAAAVRLRRVALLFTGVSVLLGAALVPSVHAQSADLSLTQTASVTTVPVSTTYSYSEVVKNVSSSATVATNTIVVYMQTPANTSFRSTGSGGTNWTCTNGTGGAPGNGYTGPLICTYGTTLASGATASTLTINMQVAAGTAAGTTILSSATVTSTVTDPVPTNNTSVVSIYVEPATSADVALSMTVAPTPIFVSASITYTIKVQNLGPQSATGVTVTDTLPASLTFGSATPSQGSCSGGLNLNCPLGTIAQGATATITVNLTTPSSATTLSNTASVTTTSTDSNSTNNSATTYTVVQPLACATPGRDGTPGSALSGVVNTYYPPTASVASASTSVTLTNAQGATTPIAIGDLLLIIQMQGASINNTNSSSYGDGLPGDPGSGASSLGNSGLFEFVTATNAVPLTGGTLTFTGTGPTGGLLNSYTLLAATTTLAQQTFQVIRVPQYVSATLSSGLVALAWNGIVGGVLAVDVSSQLTLGGTVALDALGFRGGGAQLLTGPSVGGTNGPTDYVTGAPASNTTTSGANGSKGEGIAGTPRYVAPLTITTTSTPIDAYGGTLTDSLPGGSSARGAPGNAGGGGTDGHPAANDDNSGGGAGGNGGAGGQGGYGWDSMQATNSTDGGFGGAAFPASTSALVMGGGGGAGTTNNGTYCNYNTGTATCTTSGNGNGIYSSGGAGGGIAIIHAGSVAGTGTISANGQTTPSTLNDSTGGGGAAGSILVFTNGGNLSGLTVIAQGGNGGYAWPTSPPGSPFNSTGNNRHGPGGGGGGGVIILTALPAAGSGVAGGSNGFTNTVQDSYGATPGQAGLLQTTHIITETPGTQSGAYCGSADLSVTNSGSPTIVLAGGQITYTQTVTNPGPLDAVSAVFSEATPATTTFQSITAPSGWTCTTPTVGTAGMITCTNPDFVANTSGTFTVVVNVSGSDAYGTQIVDVDNITSGTADPNLANNTATAVNSVGLATQADIAVTMSSSSPTVLAGNNFTFTAVVKNNGPATSSNLTFTEPLASASGGTIAATLVSYSATGWICTNPTIDGVVTLSCTLPTMASGGSSTISIVETAPATAPAGTVLSATDPQGIPPTLTSATLDPNYANNFATTSIEVATAGQADLAVTSSGMPNPVTAGNNITYTQSVNNLGPTAITASSSAPVTSVTFTDTIPANTTLVSFTPPANWTCNSIPVGGTGTFTCTLNNGQTLAVGASVNFPLVVKVNAGTAGGTTITNSPHVASSVSDPNTTNNTATVNTTVASPTDSFVTISKSASPEPVNQGTNLTYTIIVTNNGPAVAQGVTVTDTIPSTLTWVSSSTSQGTCSWNSGTVTVTCNIGSLSVGSVAVVTINATASVFGSGAVSCNGQTSTYTTCNIAYLGTTTHNPNTSGCVGGTSTPNACVASTIQAGTAVDLVSFSAQQQPDGSVRLRWRTLEESRNLGFHIYRDDASGRHRIDTSLIAGSALALRSSRPQHAGKWYSWVDAKPAPNASYWVEDVDVNGSRALHGPVNAESTPGTEAQSRSLAQSAEALAVSPTLRELRSAVISGNPGRRRPAMPIGPRPQPPKGTPVFNAADHAAVKIFVDQEGWYHISFAQLFAAGLEPSTDVRLLHLYAEGVEQPILLVGHSAGMSSPSDAIEFYGTGIDTPFSGTRVYWLVRENSFSHHIVSAPATSAGALAPENFPFTTIREDRTSYFAALLNGENNDNFFGDLVSSEPVDETLTVTHRDTASNEPLTLDLALQGVTDQQQHSVSVQVNGANVGTLDFYGEVLGKQSFSVDPSVVVDGTNSVTLTALDGDNDVSLVQSVALHYPHTYIADSDWLRATVTAGSEVQISGFTDSSIRLFDITDPLNIIELNGTVSSASGNYGITAVVPMGAPYTRTVLAFTPAEMSEPSSVAAYVPNFTEQQRAGADIVIVTHPDFAAHLTALVHLRSSQGYKVLQVTTDELYDRFNFGERSPYAVRSFLQNAASQWQRKPRAVLLVGDASMDPRNYLGFGDFDFVPTRIVETAAFKTASDDWFTDFQQTGYATIPTGRLPVRTAADIELIVSKIFGYEQGQSAGTWNSQVLLIADQNVDANFSSTVTAAAGALPAFLQPTQIMTDGMDPGTAHSQIIDALNSGSLIVDYNGHGSEQQWSFSDIFDGTDAAALNNGGRLPVYLLIDCLNGLFQDVYAESLAKSLMLAPSGGAVAVWASSGFTSHQPQAAMELALLNEFSAHPTEMLGLMVLRAKLATSDSDVRRTWILFGDPAMQFSVTKPVSTQSPRLPPNRPVTTTPRRVCPHDAACPGESPR